MKRKISRIFMICILLIAVNIMFFNKKTYALENTYKGFEVVGQIEIPKISLDLPILETVSQSSLRTSVAFLYGVGINQIGNTVIVGHNYQNGTFFSDLDQLESGDYIKITDMEDNVVNYKVYEIKITTPDDGSFYDRDTNGKREITLTTSTDDTTGRFVVLASETTDVIDDSNDDNNQDSSSNSTDDSVNENQTDKDNGNSNISPINTINQDNTITTKTTLPKAGRNLVLSILALITIIGIIISYYKFKKYKQV